MQCPRCSYLNEAGAQICARCGTWLWVGADSAGPAPGQGYVQPDGMQSAAQTVEGTRREDGRMPVSPETDERPAWLVQAMQGAGQTNPGGTPAPTTPSSAPPNVYGAVPGGMNALPPSQDDRPPQQTPSMPRGFAGPPVLRPAGQGGSAPQQPSPFSHPSSGNLGQMQLDAQHRIENRWSNPSLAPSTQGVPSQPISMPGQFGPQHPPTPSGPSTAGSLSWGVANQPAYPSNPHAGRFGAAQGDPGMPYVSDGPPAMSGLPSLGGTPLHGRELQPVPEQPAMLMQPLGAGTLLKSGRYRLMQRFHPLELAYAQHNEPPLMIASDTELAGGRVLVQELLLNSVRPEDTDNTRRLVAQRVQELAQTGSMPRLLDHFGERRRHFLVFEMPDGNTLAERLQRAHGPLEETVALNFALQTLDALASFERQHPAFIHGNLCPANIVIRPGGQVILVGCSPTLLLHLDGRVEHGAAGGILGYAAPEQLRGQASMRSDLFGLCATLHHAVTGVAPAPRTNVILAPARRVNPNVSLELEEALSHGLRPAPTQRYQSTSELRQALQPLASGHVTHVPEDMRAEADAAALAPVRDQRGRLVLPRQRASQNPLMLAAMIILLIALIGGGTLFTLSMRSNFKANAAPTPTPNNLVSLFQTQGIALSAGEFVFDNKRPDNDLKQQGARAMAAGDLATAENDFQGALTNDPSDAEAAIYVQDLQILRAKQAYVTMVAAVAFGQDDAAARSELQGVYLAQARVNRYRMLPGNLLLRVQILNSGAATDGVTTAAQVLISQFQQGNAQHVLGVVGWPASEQTALAISALKPAGLALVSPTATADNLGGTAANFFALVPSDSTQDAELADAAATQLNAHNIMVLSDRENQASAASATALTKRIADQHAATVHIDREQFTTNKTTDFGTVALHALYQGDQLIFLAGSDQDAAHLSQAVTKLDQTAGAAIRVLADHRVLTPALLGVGDGSPADLVRSHPDALGALLVATLADSAAWQHIPGGARSELGTFDVDYQVAFGALAEPNGLQDPDATTILSYDAARLLVAADLDIAQAKGDAAAPDPTDIRVRLLQYDQSHPFIGEGGAVVYSSAGRVEGKALALDTLRPIAGATQGKAVVRPVLDSIIGGQDLFCAKTDCSKVG